MRKTYHLNQRELYQAIVDYIKDKCKDCAEVKNFSFRITTINSGDGEEEYQVDVTELLDYAKS